MKTLLFICLAALVSACTPHEVRCEGRLERINAPAGIAGPEHP
jgi:hypothetical protein